MYIPASTSATSTARGARLCGRLVQRRFFLGLELDLDNLFDAFGAELHRNANKQTAKSVFTFEVSSARQDFFLILQNRFDHFEHGSRRGVIGRTCFEQVHDFRATFSSSGYDRFNFFLGQESREGNSSDGGITRSGTMSSPW